MAGKKPEQTRKSGGQQQQGGSQKQNPQQQQQGQPEEFENVQGEIREQDYADEMNEKHMQERQSRD